MSARCRRVFFGRADNPLYAVATTDPQGRFRATLVPGLTYQLLSPPAGRLARGVGELVVGTGQTNDLGELLLAE